MLINKSDTEICYLLIDQIKECLDARNDDMTLDVEEENIYSVNEKIQKLFNISKNEYMLTSQFKKEVLLKQRVAMIESGVAKDLSDWEIKEFV